MGAMPLDIGGAVALLWFEDIVCYYFHIVSRYLSY
jgi:hypothetical protein